jgi:sulfite exporter TauE/SafE
MLGSLEIHKRREHLPELPLLAGGRFQDLQMLRSGFEVGREEVAIMFRSQLLFWLSGLPLLFFGILGVILGVIAVSGTEIDDAAGVLFIVGGITLTLIGSVLWSFAGWRLYEVTRTRQRGGVDAIEP